MNYEHLKQKMIEWVSGHFVSQAILCAVELEIPEKLRDGPKTATELAELTACSPAHLHRLMRALCGIGVFRQSGREFRLTPLADCLRRDSDNTVWPITSLFGKELYAAFGNLSATVRTGLPGWDGAMGQPFWKYLEANPRRGEVFDSSMSILCKSEVEAIVGACDFSKVATVADIGAGNGSVLAAILKRHPHVLGVLFDEPHVVSRARELGRSEPWYARCRFESGSFFSEVPAGAERYVLRHILHDWSDNDAISILRTCKAGSPPDARFLVIEELIHEDNMPSRAKWMDLGMMTSFGGQERTLEEYQDLFAAAGLVLEKLINTNCPVSIMEVRAL